MLVSHRRFGTALGPIGCSETSVWN